MAITGECLCVSVQYEIDGPLFEARSCHCSRCRKAFSAQASAYARVNPEDFRWLRGEALLTAYHSHPDYGLLFCKQCGSTLCGTHLEAIHGITLGCLNEDPGISIDYHLFTGSKADWEVLPDGIIQFDEAPAPDYAKPEGPERK